MGGNLKAGDTTLSAVRLRGVMAMAERLLLGEGYPKSSIKL